MSNGKQDNPYLITPDVEKSEDVTPTSTPQDEPKNPYLITPSKEGAPIPPSDSPFITKPNDPISPDARQKLLEKGANVDAIEELQDYKFEKAPDRQPGESRGDYRRRIMQKTRDDHVAAWANHMQDVAEGDTPESYGSPYSLTQSYIGKAGADNSLVGMAYEVLSGQSFSKSKLGTDLYDWESYDPAVMEEVGAIAMGFIIDAPLFAFGGAVGGAIGKGAATLAVKPVVNRSAKVLLTGLKNKMVPMELAEHMVKYGAKKNAQLLGKMARGTITAGKTLGASAGALGSYNALAEGLNQMAYDDRPFSEIEWRDVAKEGLIGVEMGMALGALGMGGKYVETVVKIPGAHEMINRTLGLGVKGATIGGEVSLFAAGDAFIRGEEITKESWTNAMKMVAGAKLAHGAQSLFIRSQKAKKTDADQVGFEPNLTGVERDYLEKYRPEGVTEDINKAVMPNLEVIMGDEKIPWTAKAKLLYEKTGFYPEVTPMIDKVNMKSTEGNHLVTAFSEDGMLLDARRYTTKGEADRVAKSLMDKRMDVERRHMFDDLGKRRDVLLDVIAEKGMDAGEVISAWNRHSEYRTGAETKLVKKFYDVWDQWVAGEIEKTPKAKPKPKTELKPKDAATEKALTKSHEEKWQENKFDEITDEEIRAASDRNARDHGMDIDAQIDYEREVIDALKSRKSEVDKVRLELAKRNIQIFEDIKKSQEGSVGESVSEPSEVYGGIKEEGGGYKVFDNISGDRVKVKTVEDVDKFSGESKDLVEKIDKELERRKSITMDKDAPYAIGPKTYTSQAAFLKQLRNTPPDPHKDVGSNIRYPKDEAKLVFDAMEVAKDKFNYTEIEPSLPWVSEESLRTMREVLTSRSERLEEVRSKLLEVPENITPEIKAERESLLAGASDVVSISISPKQELQKAINSGKRMTKAENKKIREGLTEYLNDNRQRFNRLKVPVKTHIMRDINNISIGKAGYRQTQRVIEKLEKLMVDAEYRKEVQAREKSIDNLLKETDIKATTTTTSGGRKSKRKAKSTYFMAEKGVEFNESLRRINNNIRVGLENPEVAVMAIKELEKIQGRGLKRREMQLHGEFAEEIRDIEAKEGKLDRDGFTEQDHADMEMLQYIGVDKLHSKDLKELEGQVAFIKKSGRMMSEMVREEWKAETARRNAVTLKAILPKGKTILTGPQRADKKGSWLLMPQDSSLKSLLNMLESRRELEPGEKPEFMKGPLSREFLPMVQASETGLSIDKLKFAKEKRQAQYEILGIKNNMQLKNRMLDYIVQKESNVEYLDADLKTKTLSMSQGEALHMWLVSKQAGAFETFIKPVSEGGMGWTAESFKQLDKYLRPELKEYGEWMRDKMEAYEREHVSPVYAKENGVALALIDQYWPFYREAGEFNKSATDMLDRSNFRTRVASDHHIERSKSTSPFIYMDAFQVFDRYMEDQSHYKNWTETVRKMDETFKHPDIRAAITQNHGTKFMEVVDWYIDRFAGKAPSDTWYGLEKGIRMVSKGILYMNRSVGVKQMISSMMYLTDMDMAHWGSGITRMLMTTGGWEMRKYLLKQPFVRDRGMAPFDMDQNVIRTKDHYKYTEDKLKESGQRMRYNFQRAWNTLPKEQAEKVLGANIKYGDRFPIVNGGGAYVFDLMRKDGKTWRGIKNEAKREAKKKGTEYSAELDQLMSPYIDRWTALSESTQQSTRISNISKRRGSSTVGRSMAMFTSGAGQIHRVTTAATLNAYNSMRQGNMTGFYKNMRTAFISHALMGTAFSLVANGFLLDPEEKWYRNKMTWGIGLSNTKGIFGVGRVLSLLESVATNASWADKATLMPVFDTFKTFLTSLNAMLEAHEEIAEHDLSEPTEDIRKRRRDHAIRAGEALGQLLGVQAKQTFDLYDDAVDVGSGEAIHPVRQALGIYDPEYTTGVRLVESLDTEALEKARDEEEWLDAARAKGLSREEIQKQRKERFGK